MAFSQNTESPYHARSISLPSRPHPLVPQFEEHLCRLRSSEASSTSSSSLIHRLGGLRELYGCVDELLLLQPNQQFLAQSKRVDDLLDISLRLLDVCGNARNALLEMKEGIRNIQSVLRRRGSGELNIANEVSLYMSSRKKIKQATRGSLKDIKCLLDKCTSYGTKSDESVSMVGMLRETEAVTAEIFGSLLSYIASPKVQSKKSSWSVVSKFLHHSTAFNKDEVASPREFDDLDVALTLCVSHNKSGINLVEAEKLRSKMVHVEAEIQELDEVLECLFRRLVKTRAILLNILGA